MYLKPIFGRKPIPLQKIQANLYETIYSNYNIMIMKKFILTLWICLGSFSFSYSQSADVKIAEAINNSDWFALDSLYQTEPKDSIS